MLSPYRIPPDFPKRKQKSSNTTLDDYTDRDHDLKRPQMTSNDLKRSQKIELVKPDSTLNRSTSEKNKKKVDPCRRLRLRIKFSELLHNNNLFMETAMQIISNDKTVRSDIVQGLNDFNSQSSSKQAKKGEQLVSMMPAM